MESIDWKNLFKIRIANSDDSFQKHEVVKLIMVMKLMKKYRRNKASIRVYTERELNNGAICDVYFENLKSKEVIAYEIQTDYTPAWLEDRKKKYQDWEVAFFTSADWIPIDLNKCTDNISEINTWLDQYVI